MLFVRAEALVQGRVNSRCGCQRRVEHVLLKFGFHCLRCPLVQPMQQPVSTTEHAKRHHSAHHQRVCGDLHPFAHARCDCSIRTGFFERDYQVVQSLRMRISRLEPVFEQVRARGEIALIAYITAGDPSLKQLPAVLQLLQDSGVDMVEVGFPFSDPLADGPVI